MHIFSAAGTHSVCMSVTAYRKNGYVCSDTFCNPISITVLSAQELAKRNITIAPNPASDHLYVTGATNTDVISLLDLYGQTVFSSALATPTVNLPHSLPTGIYYAVITTVDGNKIFKKLFISQ